MVPRANICVAVPCFGYPVSTIYYNPYYTNATYDHDMIYPVNMHLNSIPCKVLPIANASPLPHLAMVSNPCILKLCVIQTSEPFDVQCV